jgi:Ca2+-binding RTX toxin-like protein
MQPRRDEHPEPHPQRQSPPSPSYDIEALEGRLLLSGVTLDKSLKKLFVDGTSKGDRIILQRDSTNPELLAININGTVTVRDFERFKRVVIRGGKGNDRIIVDDAFGQLPTSRIMQLFGNSGNDTLTGCMNDDEFNGGGGDDLINGRDGNDLEFGDVGNDTIFGQAGEDSLQGGDGDDSIDGGAGNDSLLGDDGFDTLIGGVGDDTIHGGASRDKIYGNEGADVLFGDGGNDRILDGPGSDIITP